MEKGLFQREYGGDFISLKKKNKFKEKVDKIMRTKETKRNFLPLFDCLNPEILTEEKRHQMVFEVARKYFEMKENIEKEIGWN